MRRILVLAVVVLVTSPLVVHAQPPRIAAFQLQCFRPTTPAYHTSATLIARIILANRTVWAVASCQDGPAHVTWPEVQWEDGQVLSLDVWMTAQLLDPTLTLVRETGCATWSGSGYYTGRCIADEALGGEVQVLVSIAP